MWMRRPGLIPAVAFVLLAAGCTSGQPERAPTAAIVFPFLDDRFGEAADVIEQRLTAEGWDVEVRGVDGDIPAQVETVAEYLDADVDALVVWPIDATSLTTVLDEASDATFVVSIETLIRDTAQLDVHVSFGYAAEGRLQAEALVEQLGVGLDGAEPYRVELFAGSPEQPRTQQAFSGVMGVLEPYIESGDLVVASGETTLGDVTTLRGTDDAAASRMGSLLREWYPDGPPDAVLASSDEIARGVADALLDAGATPGEGFPLVTGRGAQLRSLAALVDGRQFMTLLEDPRALAELAADSIVSEAVAGYPLDNGEIEVIARYAEPVVVRVGDIDEVVVDSGYWSRERVDDAIAEYGL